MSKDEPIITIIPNNTHTGHSMDIVDLLTNAAKDKEKLSNIIRAITVGVRHGERGVINYTLPIGIWDNIIKQAQGK